MFLLTGKRRVPNPEDENPCDMEVCRGKKEKVVEMGWTYYNANHYTKRGTVDRKAECDSMFNTSWNYTDKDGIVHPLSDRVVKSAMVGRVWYGAVERSEGGVPKYTTALVLLTSSDNKRGWNFGYKDMSESMGPFERQCPVSVLKCLSSIEELKSKSGYVGYAEEWRRDCYAYAENKGKTEKARVPACMTAKYRGGWVLSSANYRRHNRYVGVRYGRCNKEKAVKTFVTQYCPMMAMVKKVSAA